MHRAPTISLLLLPLLLAAVLTTGTALAEDRVASRSSERIDEPISAERPLYGPILSKDPATRAQIKHLYLERHSLGQETLIRLDELNRAYVAETDADFRWELANEMGELKRTLEIRNIEIGLDIARLNGQGRRAAEYELALDQILNPEKYFPAHRPDPALKAARLLEHGQK